MSDPGEKGWAERRVAVLEAENARLRSLLAAAGLDAGGDAAAETGLRAAARFRALADTIPNLVWRSRAGGQWVWASPNWLSYTGQTAEESRGQGWLAAIHPDDREAAGKAWAQAEASGHFEIEHRILRASDGAWRLHQSRCDQVRGGVEPVQEERPPEWVGVSADVEDLRRLQGEQCTLLLEVQHRTRNLLAVVRTMAQHSLPATPERDDFGARLAAMGRVQGFLARTGAWAVPLRDLVEAELRALGGGEAGKAEVTGPKVNLPGQVVQPLALALHELAVNAAKHGAIAQSAGQLAVVWWLEDEGRIRRLVIEWREQGVAMPPDPSARRFGRRVIERTVPYQLGGEARMELSPDGVRCRLALPLIEREVPARPL
ncbi:PAS domain S-box protein [Roseomonas nepalensis]|uniref:histidine kinase n=1 Tax=Muricoccus nepalensis TaxID=1854500 RepID=A0A502GBA6_9PROT|nr:HWE histidine kinase domain-containing protein [Roseomonas nepalensis]TPG58620.1 PAS domain S-box protein [Roseomonas nepalensis]